MAMTILYFDGIKRIQTNVGLLELLFNSISCICTACMSSQVDIELFSYISSITKFSLNIHIW